MGELESHTGKRSAGHMKNLITITTDNFRAPYGKNNEPHRRGSVFCGTVNEESFLRDETGNRRYWVVPITGTEPLDRDGLTVARDGIWRAALAAYRANELPMLTRAQEALSEIQNETFTHSDPWLEKLQAAIESNPPRWQMPFSTAEALAAAGLKNSEQITRADETRLAPVLRQLGFDKAKHPATTGDGKRIRLWSTAQPAQPLHNLNAGGCAPPKRLQGNGSQRTAQPAQPISSKKTKGGDEQTAAAATASLNVETGCAGCAPQHPPGR
jgi:predicted P-loop ATPase